MHPQENFSDAASVGSLWHCGTLNSPNGAYCATMEQPSGQTLATNSCGIWSYSERPKEFLLTCYKNLHSFLWAKQAGFLLVWILWLSCAICQKVCLPGKEQLPLIVFLRITLLSCQPKLPSGSCPGCHSSRQNENVIQWGICIKGRSDGNISQQNLWCCA